MIRREAEEREVVRLVLDLRAIEDGEAELTEDSDHLLAHDRDGVLVPSGERLSAGKGQVERRRGELDLTLPPAELTERRVEAGLDLLLEGVDLLADGLAPCGGRLPEELQDPNPRGIWRLVDGGLTRESL